MLNASSVVVPIVSIIVVNFNTTKLLLDCLHSIDVNFSIVPYEVIVVDNASTGFDPVQVTGSFPDVTVVVGTTNRGFGQANNLGAERARGTYLWLLNPDTIIPTSHNLGALLTFLETHPLHGAASPLLVGETGTVQPGQRAYFPRLDRMMADKAAKFLGRLFPGGRALWALADYDFHAVVEADVPVVVAASMFVRRTAFFAVGGFSPSYFMFYEDSDLCRKLAAAGMGVRFVPRSQVVHLWGKSIGSQQERKRLYYASQDVYLRTWSRPAIRVLAKFLRTPFELKHKLTRRR